MDIEKPVIVIYTEEIARDAVWTFVWRRAVVNQKTLWLVEAAMTALLGLMIFYGARDWLMAVVVTAVLLPPCLVVAAWFANYRNTVGKFRRMPSKQATFVFHEEGFEVTSELGATALPWSRITGLWKDPAIGCCSWGTISSSRCRSPPFLHPFKFFSDRNARRRPDRQPGV